MTIQELKDTFGYLGVKFKKSLPSDYIITNEDIINGNVVQKFIDGKRLSNIVNGLTIIDNQIYYAYVEPERIEIVTGDFFPSCGGKLDLYIQAIYRTHVVDSNGNEKVDDSISSCKVNGLVNIDNNEFEYNKLELINEKPNNTDKNKNINVSATYYYNGKKYTCNKTIVQEPNKVSDWKIESETTTDLKIILSKTAIDKSGGTITARVERQFSRLYQKVDMCGKIVAEKNEPGHIEDVTDSCLFSNENKEMSFLNKGIIKVKQQGINAPKRTDIITATFYDFTAFSTIEQEEGAKMTRSYKLCFENESFNNTVELGTSLKKEIELPIISKVIEYVDNELYKEYNTKELIINTDSDWVKVIASENKSGVNLLLSVIKPNNNKSESREAKITITNPLDRNAIITLTIYQPSMNVIRESFVCKFYGSGIYTAEELDDVSVYFKVFKTDIYEDGSKNIYEYDDYVPFMPSYASTNDELLSVTGIDYIGGKYVVELLNLTKKSTSDINIKIYLVPLISDKQIICEPGNIIVKGNILTTYEYELCFDKHDKFKSLKWDNSKETKLVNVKSLKYTLKNGAIVETEYLPFNISIQNESGNEYFDDSFSVKANGDSISICPNNVYKSTSKTYTITQLDSKLSLSLKLDYTINELIKNIPLKVILYSKSLNHDLWTGGDGYLLVDGKSKVALNPCWLSPDMMDNFDVAYNGSIDLTEGLHTFEAFNMKDIKFKEEIVVNQTTNTILLTINV